MAVNEIRTLYEDLKDNVNDRNFQRIVAVAGVLVVVTAIVICLL